MCCVTLQAKDGVIGEGMVGYRFNTIGVSDGISMGTSGGWTETDYAALGWKGYLWLLEHCIRVIRSVFSCVMVFWVYTTRVIYNTRCVRMVCIIYKRPERWPRLFFLFRNSCVRCKHVFLAVNGPFRVPWFDFNGINPFKRALPIWAWKTLKTLAIRVNFWFVHTAILKGFTRE